MFKYQKLKKEIRELEERIEAKESEIKELNSLNNSYYGRIETYEQIWKKYNLQRYYSINNEEFAILKIKTNLLEDYEFKIVHYEIDEKFIIIFTKSSKHYIKLEDINVIDIKYIKSKKNKLMKVRCIDSGRTNSRKT